MNFYEQPAQAQFVNTYVPIPFEQLMSVASAYKQDYDKNIEALKQYNKEIGDFQSLSTRDMETWNAATKGRISSLVDTMAANPDALKDIGNRAKLSNLINTTDYSLLGKLKTNAAALSEAAKTYDPRWEDDTMEKIANWNTMDQGLYTGRNIEYKSIQDISNPYFDLLGKEKFLGKSKDGMYDEYGITTGHLQTVADDKTINEIYQSPEGKKHVELARKRGLIPEGMSDRDYLKDAVIQSQIGRVGVTRREENRFALEDYKSRLAEARSTKKGKGKASDTIPVTKYDQLAVDSDSAINRLLSSSDLFAKKQLVELTALDAEAKQAVAANNEAFKEGKITEDQLLNNLAQLNKEYGSRQDALVKQLQSPDMLSNGVANMFKDMSGIDIRTGKSNVPRDTQLYSASAYRAANDVIDQLSPTDVDASYTDKWLATATNGNAKTINVGGIPRTAFMASSTAGAELTTEYVNKLAKGNINYNYDIKKIDGTKGNVAKDITQGRFKNVIVVPNYKVLTQTGKDGAKELVQKFTYLIPKESVSEAGYDPATFEKNTKRMFGNGVITNVSDKNVKEGALKDAYGTTRSGGWFSSDGFGSEIDRVPQSLVGDFYQFEVMKPMPRQSSITNTVESLYDKQIGGTTLGKENLDYRASDIYGNDAESALMGQLNGEE